MNAEVGDAAASHQSVPGSKGAEVHPRTTGAEVVVAEKAPLRIGDVTLASPVLAAPMTGVTDLPFRRALVRAGAVYVATEMVAAGELARGRPDVVRRAAVGEGLPLTVIQLVGAGPPMIAAGARMAEAAGADIIDLNFGCPAKEVTGAACGAALMRDLDAAERLIAAAVEATSRPVTVKMRLGWDATTLNAPELARRAERVGAQALTVHGRTRAQGYTGDADWAAVAAVKREVGIPVMINGDIVDGASALSALKASGADGVMLGRGLYGRPWNIAHIDAALAGLPLPTIETTEWLADVLAHHDHALRFYGDGLGSRTFRKHLGWYIDYAPVLLPATARTAIRKVLCRKESPREVVAGLIRLTQGDPLDKAA